MRDIKNDILKLISARYRQNAMLDLFDDGRLVDFAHLSDRWLEFVYHNREDIREALEEDETRAALAELLNGLRKLLARDTSFDAFADESAETMRAHFFSLRAFLGSTSDAPLLAVSGPVPCREYTPALQLEMLGVTPDELAEPVLDLGCGKRGKLVRYLRSRGIEAYGVDRFASSAPYLAATDWLRMPFRPAKWGTILSHMSFSNHFVHHHLRRDGDSEAYARKYMEMLRVLKPGGVFICTPALPSIEQHLPGERFRVDRHGLAVHVTRVL